MKKVFLASFVILAWVPAILPVPIHAQAPAGEGNGIAFVDDKGLLRWQESGKEICRYGVNYTVPFAHAYRAAGYLDTDREVAIGQDVYHMARMGLDAFRVHVWDCEISDTLGNLLENEHLRLLDYQLKAMSERGMKFIITPIAYWGNGYPEPEEDTPGFSTKYGKGNCLTNPDAIRVQEVYLGQFMRHVNPYTGVAYKDDPNIIAFEVSNEPHHGGSAEETTAFINRMVQAIRRTGCRKPVFYNVSHSTRLAPAYYAADIQGGTFQWYPSGLVAGHEIRGNFLPNVTAYEIPFDTVPGYGKAARIVYEYDAADIGRSYIHPYIAKSFREAGMQFVAQFSYDPMFMAFANTEYQTHYMNFAYAPQKALSLKIASEVFHRMPAGGQSPGYPSDTVFDVFRVSYALDLAEMITGEKFIYTNHTTSRPPSPGKLEHVAGYGTSPVVGYEGYGAYILDRIEEGVWRLEVMPDAIWVRDPFERASLEKKVSVILHREHPMRIRLPDLGEDFGVRGLNQGNGMEAQASDGGFIASPGTYLLVRKGKAADLGPETPWKNIRLGEFVAPASNCDRTYLVHRPATELTAGEKYRIEATVASLADPERVELQVFAGWRPVRFEMAKTGPYTWAAELDSAMVRTGYLNYYIVVEEKDRYLCFPQGVPGRPSDWDFTDRESWSVPVVDPGSPVLLFDALTDAGMIYGNTWIRQAPSKDPGGKVSILQFRDPGEGPGQIAARFYCHDRISKRGTDLMKCREICLQGYSTTAQSTAVEIALVLDDGTSYGGMLEVGTEPGTYRFALENLRRVKTINLPRTYPGFLPFYSEGTFEKPFDIRKVESIQFSIGPGMPETESGQPCGLAVEKAFLE